MPGKDFKTKRQHHARVRRFIKKLIATHGLTQVKQLRFGKRYYVARAKQGKQSVILKTCLYPRSYDHLTNEKFTREVLFLNHIDTRKRSALWQSTPRIYAHDTGSRAWYIRENIIGAEQNIGGGNIRFAKKFFTQRSLKWVVSFISELQRLRARNMPKEFQQRLHKPQSPHFLWRFIAPSTELLDKELGMPGVSKDIRALFIKNQKLYVQSPRVLTHQELYAPHVLDVQGQYKVIDWENIGWGSIIKDGVTVWMRASSHPAWQHQLYQRLRRNTPYNKFDQLWTIVVLMQSVFNIIAYTTYPEKNDFRSLAQFSQRTVKQILSNTFKP